MRNLARALALLPAALLLSVAAHADTINDNFLTTDTPFGVISGTLPASPTPTSFTADSFDYTVSLIVDGDPMTVPVVFYTDAGGGGAQGDGYHVLGPALFTGSTSDPTFLTGTFAFSDFDLTISPEAAPIPEPATILLFGTGAFALYAFGRRKLSSVIDRA